MKRGKSLKRRTRLRQRNHKRRRRLQAEQFGDQGAWIRTLPCCICRRPSTEDYPTTSSHVKGRGAGGKSDQQVPMCGRCHGEYEENKPAWNERYRLPELAAALHALWVQMQQTDAVARPASPDRAAALVADGCCAGLAARRATDRPHHTQMAGEETQ